MGPKGSNDFAPLPSPLALSQVGGHLQTFWRAWDFPGTDPWVVSALREGYQIPFKEKPPLTLEPLTFSSYRQGSERFVALDEAVSSMREKAAIEEPPSSPGFYSSIFITPKVTGGWRPIINLRPLNQFVKVDKFKMETPRTVLQALRPGDWMFSVDLKDAYFQVPIHPRSRRFLRFLWRGRAWQFRALCFGLSTAPQVFTRVMGPVALLAHRRGVRLHRYLDDWLVAAQDKEELLVHRAWLLEQCLQLGLIINWEKSELSPSKSVIYLGIQIDTDANRVRPSSKRIDRFLLLLQEFSSNPSPSAWEWLRLLGHMTSLEKLLPLGRLHMRSFQFCLRETWSQASHPVFSRVETTVEVWRDVLWWSDRANLEIGVPLSSPTPDVLLYSDASSQGWGAHMDDLQASGLWSDRQKSWHINLKELRAVRLGLETFRDYLVGKSVVSMSDNSTVVAYIKHQGGTRSQSLCQETLLLLQWAQQHRITLSSQFIPGSSNVVADQLSRRKQVLPAEWTLHELVCRQIWRVWEYPQVDLFATAKTHRLPSYFSPVQDPQALGTDALVQDWSGMVAYAFPPLPLIRRVINKVRASSNLRLFLIAPCWPQQEWFPDLLDLLTALPLELPWWPRLLKQPHLDRFHGNVPGLALHAWQLSSEASARRAFRLRLLGGSQLPTDVPLPTSTSPSGQFSGVGVIEGVSLHAIPLFPS